MTDQTKAGWVGAAVVLILLSLFFLYIEAFFVLIASIIIGFPIGVVAHKWRNRG